MLFLAEFSPIVPEIGMIFWAFIVFLLTWLVIGRFTFKPIARALRDREDSISNALAEADRARKEMERIQAENAIALKQQQEANAQLMREAQEAKNKVIAEARAEAEELKSRLMRDAQQEIEALKSAAILDVKNNAGQIAIDIAEKVLRRQLADQGAQQAYAESLVKEIKLN